MPEQKLRAVPLNIAEARITADMLERYAVFFIQTGQFSEIEREIFARLVADLRLSADFMENSKEKFVLPTGELV